MNHAALLLSVLALAACNPDVGNPTDIPSGVPRGAISVDLLSGQDGELDPTVQEVWVRFEDVQVHHDDKGWLSVTSERQDVDLLALRAGGEKANIGHARVWEGAYDTLRLIIADSWIVVDGQQFDLTITERLEDLAQPGIDFHEAFFVDKSTATTLTARWDLNTQLHESAGVWSLGTAANLDVQLEGQ